ncbi:MAG: flagellar hook capping FlgD N-terminal domain-containing protein [Rubrivivax sp.]|nr:flagellar hook capping FlgD N-terminal domain-containing protein [Rubrivivax sp.]
MTTTAAVNPYAALNAATSSTKTANEAGSADRFLKLLVTQMQHQDPLNPMDNAQITSQMAQINTVNGIEQLNTTVEGLTGQFMQLQALTGASLVGRDVTLKGNKLDIKGGVGVGGFDLTSTADRVKVEVLNPGGSVVDTIDLGAETAGRHAFTWPAGSVPDGANYSFRVTATAGAATLATTPLMRDRVESVNTSGNNLMLNTRTSGPVAYSDIKAFN